MNNNNLDQYYEEERSLFLDVLNRIRTFFIVLFFVVIVILNYIFLPGLLLYPWILLVYAVYTVYKLLHPFSVFGYFGDNIARKAKTKLVKEIDGKTDNFEKWKKQFHAKMHGRDPM